MSNVLQKRVDDVTEKLLPDGKLSAVTTTTKIKRNASPIPSTNIEVDVGRT